MDDTLRIADLRTPGDLDRLEIRDYVTLATTPVTRLDLLRLQLAVSERLQTFADALNERST